MRIVLLETAILIYSFTAAAFRSDRPSVTDDPWALVRLAIPVLAALLGLLLRNAYANEPRAPHDSAVDVIVAFSLAVATQAVIPAQWALPRWAPTQGGLLGMILLAASRALFSPGKAQLTVRPPTRAVYLSAAALSGSLALYGLVTGVPRVRVASAILLAGSFYLALVIRFTNSFLRWTTYWFYGSLFPACALYLSGARVYEHLLLVLILMAAELNHRAAEEAGAASPPVKKVLISFAP